MRPIQTAITGREYLQDNSSPLNALSRFYRAFNGADLLSMSESWEQSDEISMDNPLGGIKRGWNDIRAVYERIFNSPAEVYVEFYDYTIHETPEMFCAVGRERGFFRLEGNEISLAIRTSRIFRKTDGQWKQVHHHGSIDDPDLLGRYQKAVVRGN